MNIRKPQGTASCIRFAEHCAAQYLASVDKANEALDDNNRPVARGIIYDINLKYGDLLHTIIKPRLKDEDFREQFAWHFGRHPIPSVRLVAYPWMQQMLSLEQHAH